MCREEWIGGCGQMPKFSRTIISGAEPARNPSRFWPRTCDDLTCILVARDQNNSPHVTASRDCCSPDLQGDNSTTNSCLGEAARPMASAALASVPQAAKSVLAAAARRTGNTTTGVVVSAGLAQKTAKVRVGGEIWNRKVQKVCVNPGSPAAANLLADVASHYTFKPRKTNPTCLVLCHVSPSKSLKNTSSTTPTTHLGPAMWSRLLAAGGHPRGSASS